MAGIAAGPLEVDLNGCGTANTGLALARWHLHGRLDVCVTRRAVARGCAYWGRCSASISDAGWKAGAPGGDAFPGGRRWRAGWFWRLIGALRALTIDT